MVQLTSILKAGRTAAKFANDANTARAAANDFRQADKAQMGRDAGRMAFSEGANTGAAMGKTWLKTFEVVPRLVVRGLQFVFALVAVGFYGHRVDADRKAERAIAPEWLFAVVVCGLSALTAVAFVLAATAGAIPVVGGFLKMLKTHRAFGWDATLWIGWLVVFGMNAGIFLKRSADDPYKGASVRVMKVAVWVDLVNAVFWMLSAAYGCIKTFLGAKVDAASEKVGNKLFSKKGGNKHEMKNMSTNV
ncbi:hypothetical protein CCM_07057 [Cordyceps militaris CM01]|uniref:Uracil phosphoribosyltransferase n=1 Tax=Cordyceps militaris (strain CM01) TaxID=983644 RepID=G3JLR3_CORMM|nr:uncharacterized protein CCM_07057 [Cordyceps militaris CM01]EGX90637.1 hypothetical protein CCM_07057 [Cordyceps militaris CM01]